MANNSVNYYKICRKIACFTQEHAAERLNVDVRRLSDYENDHALPPEDVVNRMAHLYNAPDLAIWHMKEKTLLGREWLPDIYPTRTPADVWMQTAIAGRYASSAEEHIFAALGDGQLTADDIQHMDSYIRDSDAAAGNLMSAKAYVSKVRNELKQEAGAA